MRSNLAAPNNESQLNLFFKNQDTIRVLLDNAGGFGNQASTFNLINKIRAYGFEGTFEIIYPEDVIKKFPKLLGIPKNIPSFYAYDHPFYKKIILINQSEYVRRLNNQQVPIVELGVTGAFDSEYLTECKNQELNCFNKHNNFARFSNSKVFVSLDPWYMHQDYSQKNAYDQIHFLYGSSAQIYLDARSKFFNMPLTTLEHAKQFLTNDSVGIIYLEKTPAMGAFIKGVEENSFNVLPVYGFSFLEAYGPNYASNILQVLAAARFAQLHGNEEMHNRPLIISVFYEFEKELAQLNKFIHENDWRLYETTGVENIKSVLERLSLSVLQTASLSDKNTLQIINQLKAGDILLLSMGKLPGKNLFDGLYSMRKPNIWPQVREGQGSLSTLVLGGAHLRCAPGNKWEFGSDFNDNLEVKEWLANIYHSEKGFCSSKAWENNPDLYQILGQFYIDAQNPNSPISLYFKNLREAALNPKHDRIANGLNAAIHLLQASQSANHSLYDKVSQSLIAKLENTYRYGASFAPLLQIAPDDSNKQSIFKFTKAEWDTNIQIDPYTHAPIFTFKFFNDDDEIASADFYGQPSFCISKDGQKTNLIKTTGALERFKITDSKLIDDICDILPLSFENKIYVNAMSGALHGCAEVSHNLINHSLKSYGMRKAFANYISHSMYYGAYFSWRLNQYYSMQNNVEPSHYLNGLYHAIFDTGQLWLIRELLQKFSAECEQLSQHLKEQNKTYSRWAVNIVGALTKFSVFAHSAAKVGVMETTSSLVSGTAVQLTAEAIGYGFKRARAYMQTRNNSSV